MTKKYGIRNTSECVLRLPVGKGWVVCNFTNGNLQSREPIPASYTTSNPIIQYAIENCDRFKSKKIFIMSEYGNDPEPENEVETAPAVVEPEKPKKAKKAAKTDKATRVNEDVKTYGEAVTVLMTMDGVTMSDLPDVDACIRVGEELGISFPNLK
jgi:hypothetical protein